MDTYHIFASPPSLDYDLFYERYAWISQREVDVITPRTDFDRAK